MPFPLVALIFAGISFAANSLLNRRPKAKPLKPSDLSEFSFPSADENRPIPYIAGTLPVVPNITFFGDLSTTPISQFVKTSLLGTGVRQQLGFRYNVGMELGLCFGANVHCKRITVDDKEIFVGDLVGSPATTTILKESLFGGEGEDGEGGINVTLDFYEGNSSQVANPYMVTQYARQNGHRDVCYAVWRGPSYGSLYQAGKYVSGGGYIGKVPQIRPMKFYLQRIPVFLGAGTATIGEDANAADVLYELATSRLFGAGLSPSKLNSPAFAAMAATLKAEDFGISVLWERTDDLEAVIQSILDTVDAAFYTDLQTGLITPRLIRKDYDPNTILHLTDDEVLDIKSFSRGSWEETKNEVRLEYTNRAEDYQQKTAFAQDRANFQIRNATDPVTIDYKYITNATNAQKVAFRECRRLSVPLARATLTVNRYAAQLTPGAVFKWSTTKTTPTISNKVMRVLKVDYGKLADTTIELFCAEDIFALGGAIYSVNTSTNWVNPVTDALAPNPVIVQEQPYWYAGAAFRPWTFARQPNGSHLAWDLNISTDGGATYSLKQADEIFTPVGVLFANYSQNTADVDATGFEIINLAGMEGVFAPTSASEIASSGTGLIYFEDTGEIAAFESIVFNTTTGRYEVKGIWRGLLDTTPANHGTATRVWFFANGQSRLAEDFSGTIQLKHLTRTSRNQLSLASATAYPLTNNSRTLKPYPPSYLRINGSYTTATHTGDVSLQWNSRNRLTQTTILKQSDASVAAEGGTTYTLTIRNNLNAVIRLATLIAGTSYTYTLAQETIDNGGAPSPTLTFELVAVVGANVSTVYRKTTTRV